ncbi:thioredoxin family protein [Aquimarina sediminis]|uniref:thioredoxin family protein n=1 Tax=Aquimarina sediminis TaxID=2070536 RepID=UPI000CA02A95|nr:thioredoxin family protein [Aquimarina sediminis]
MRKTLLLTLAVLALSCNSTSTVVKNSSTQQTKDVSKPEILVGKQGRGTLEQEPYKSWFNKNYENYTIDTNTIKQLSPYLKGVTIKIFMGTWCGDSKRETPTFYKILDNTDFDYKNLELITVSREKDTPEGFEKDLNIMRVPTFIFYKDEKEMGRYVEFARETLEKDILAIISDKSYKHSYED